MEDASLSYHLKSNIGLEPATKLHYVLLPVAHCKVHKNSFYLRQSPDLGVVGLPCFPSRLASPAASKL